MKLVAGMSCMLHFSEYSSHNSKDRTALFQTITQRVLIISCRSFGRSIEKATNKLQLYRFIYYSQSVLNFSGNVFAHHQEHLTVFTASGSIHSSRCRLVSWMSWNADF